MQRFQTMNPIDQKHPLPAIIKDILTEMLNDSDTALQSLFASCDTLFFDLSNRASSDAEVNLYYDSKKALKEFQADIVENYHKGIVWNFLCAASGKPLPHTAKQKHIAQSDLELVNNRQLEIDITINNIASNIRNSYYKDLKELALRLNHLLPNTELDDESNPFDPFHIGHAFAFACQRYLDLDIKCLVILFKQYERHILNQLGHSLVAANERLISGEVLPQIPDTRINNDAKETIATTNSVNQISLDAPLGDATLSQLSNITSLLSAIRSENTEEPRSHYSPTQYSHASGPVMSAAELLNKLAIIQHEPKTTINYIKKFVSGLVFKDKTESPQALTENDDNTISLVSMFFDFIFDDDNISTAIRFQISRLQLPILKSALKDRSFLTSPTHPGRALINTMAAVGISFDEQKTDNKDRIYKVIETITNDINADYSVHDDVFTPALTALNNAVTKEARRSDLIEHRTQQAESGRAKLKNAKNVVKGLLIEKLTGANMPNEVKEFMTSTWLNVLVMTHLKKGENSSEWISASQTIDDLVWVCQAHSSPRAIDRINQFKTELIGRIQSGMQLVEEKNEGQITIKTRDRKSVV
mgnify:CR=1 FL=1